MIKAEPKRWARFIFNPYIDRLLRKNFLHFYLVNEPPSVENDRGLLITPNHFSWWDGFFIDFVMRRYKKRTLHIMMLEEQLKRYWFFRKLGAYSIDLQHPAESLRYTREILTNPAHYVVFYPQGEIEPYDKRPLKLKTGLQRILQSSDRPVSVIPAAFKIQYGNEKKPDVIARFSSSLQGEEIVNDFGLFTSTFSGNIDKLDEAGQKKEYIKDLFS